MIDQHRIAFKEEASELLVELESSLLELEKFPDDKELIAKVFRALHTIKGSSGMFGYDDITMFTHDVESIFDFVRSGKYAVNKELIDITLRSLDYIKAMLEDDASKILSEMTEAKELIQAFRNIANSVKGTVQTPKGKTGVIPEVIESSNQSTYYIRFKPFEDIFMSGTNPVFLINELRGLGSAKIRANISSFPHYSDFNPEKSYTVWNIILSSSKSLDTIKDVFIFVEDDAELVVLKIDDKASPLDEVGEKLFFNEIDAATDYSEKNIKSIYSVFTLNQQINFAKTKDIERTDNTRTHQEVEAVSSLRVSADKVDHLVNLVGELVTLQAQLTSAANLSGIVNLMNISESVERITWDLRDSALNIRMLPIGTTFGKFNRLIRDLSRDLGKEVELIAEGAETELDKTVIEKISDPLIHLLRNSLDHGIESPEVRIAAGKNRVGKIKLKAFQSGGNVIIQITDDGAGVDKEAVRKKAIASGVLPPETELTESELFSLVFSAGFSTAAEITNVSGRGVGMDVVKRAIDGLRGSIEMKSVQGVGTTISLKIPLTLAIIDGLLIQVADEYFILALSSVEECIELTSKDTEASHGRNIVSVRGEIVPHIRLREFFQFPGEKPDIEQVVIVGINGNRIGFTVDSVVGQHQTVLKTLGALYRNIEGISGATILGDGRIALMLDVQKLSELEEKEEKTQVA